jgi:hypothetical protein
MAVLMKNGDPVVSLEAEPTQATAQSPNPARELPVRQSRLAANHGFLLRMQFSRLG